MKRKYLILAVLVTIVTSFVAFKVGSNNHKQYESCLKIAASDGEICTCNHIFNIKDDTYCNSYTKHNHKNALEIYTNSNIYYIWYDNIFIKSLHKRNL